MTIFTLPGTVTNAVTHFALYGLAAIYDHETGAHPRVSWSNERQPRALLDIGDSTSQSLARAVHQHACRHSKPDSWIQHTHQHEGRPTATFSPRIKTPSSNESWTALQHARHQTLDALHPVHGHLDWQMIGALGEPAYWRTDGNEPRPDEGASRWEMKTRNQGEEFVGQRLAPLADAVAARTVDQVLSGLLGETVTDESGKNSPKSRTATGLSRPGPVDNALAWCALWGISQFPVVHRLNRQSATAGTHVPGRRAAPASVFVPVPVQPLSMARMRNVLASQHLAVAGANSRELETQAARKWLSVRGIRALITFPVRVTDNPTAPERYLLDGMPTILETTAGTY
ncbi:hypothetical protein [Nocardia transvalensis]|uniref:hypothetical protein n=1 Tax=Nocardia transvalensis TaxID=37333 RepID=UPI00189566C3|nr:hypothetical protein [Nocardia transvalensis]MBF6332409.1 hypothetical protein [Nocardia transvalensis]